MPNIDNPDQPELDTSSSDPQTGHKISRRQAMKIILTFAGATLASTHALRPGPAHAADPLNNNALIMTGGSSLPNGGKVLRSEDGTEVIVPGTICQANGTLYMSNGPGGPVFRLVEGSPSFVVNEVYSDGWYGITHNGQSGFTQVHPSSCKLSLDGQRLEVSSSAESAPGVIDNTPRLGYFDSFEGDFRFLDRNIIVPREEDPSSMARAREVVLSWDQRTQNGLHTNTDGLILGLNEPPDIGLIVYPNNGRGFLSESSVYQVGNDNFIVLGTEYMVISRENGMDSIADHARRYAFDFRERYNLTGPILVVGTSSLSGGAYGRVFYILAKLSQN